MDVSSSGDGGEGRRLLGGDGTLEAGAVVVGATYLGRTFEAANADRAYFTDSLFRDCIFDRCSFRRCDFEAVIFETCTFLDCDFSSADFRSTEFAGCSIINGKFPNGAMTSCTFRSCKLENCRFYRQAFAENRLHGCTLTQCRFHRSTVLHIEFTECGFQRTSIADCTSLYHIFEACSFEASEMNIDNIALTFGLTRENLSSLRLVWQGKRASRDQDVQSVLDKLLLSLGSRGWGVPASILAINFALTPTREAFRIAFAGLAQSAGQGRPLRSDEVRFFSRVVEILAERNSLPFLAVMQGLDLCANLADERPEREEALRPLAYALREAEVRAIAAWDRDWQALRAVQGDLLAVEFTFDKKPAANLLEILRELHGVTGDRRVRPELLSARSGSYIEVLYMTVVTLMALLMCTGLTVRILDNMVIIREKFAMLVSPRRPPSIRARALEAPPTLSEELSGNLRLFAGLLARGQTPLTAAGVDAIASQLRQITVSPAQESAPQEH